MIDVLNLHQFTSAMVAHRMERGMQMREALAGKAHPQKTEEGAEQQVSDVPNPQGLPTEHPLNFTTDWTTHPDPGRHPLQRNSPKASTHMGRLAAQARAFDEHINQRLAEMRNQNP